MASCSRYVIVLRFITNLMNLNSLVPSLYISVAILISARPRMIYIVWLSFMHKMQFADYLAS